MYSAAPVAAFDNPAWSVDAGVRRNRAEPMPRLAKGIDEQIVVLAVARKHAANNIASRASVNVGLFGVSFSDATR